MLRVLFGGSGCWQIDGHDGEADAVVGDALVNLQFVDEGAGEREVDILAVVADGHDGGKFFYDSGKHDGYFRFTEFSILD